MTLKSINDYKSIFLPGIRPASGGFASVFVVLLCCAKWSGFINGSQLQRTQHFRKFEVLRSRNVSFGTLFFVIIEPPKKRDINKKLWCDGSNSIKFSVSSLITFCLYISKPTTKHLSNYIQQILTKISNSTLSLALAELKRCHIPSQGLLQFQMSL